MCLTIGSVVHSELLLGRSVGSVCGSFCLFILLAGGCPLDPASFLEKTTFAPFLCPLSWFPFPTSLHVLKTLRVSRGAMVPRPTVLWLLRSLCVWLPLLAVLLGILCRISTSL